MGLDNGIRLGKGRPDYYPCYVKLDDRHKNCDDLCYWRKCWNIREDILDIVGEEDEQYEYILTREDVHAIRRALQVYFKYPHWWSRSIWTWKEIRRHLFYDVVNLWWLERYMKKHEVEVYFYDSY